MTERFRAFIDSGAGCEDIVDKKNSFAGDLRRSADCKGACEVSKPGRPCQLGLRRRPAHTREVMARNGQPQASSQVIR